MASDLPPESRISLSKARPSGPLREGEDVVLVDRKGRRYMTPLSRGRFHTHMGYVELGEAVGKEEGWKLTTPEGAHLLVFRPTYEDVVLRMKRGAQVIYPKDAARIATLLDCFPGASVLEAGIGSGALTLLLLLHPIELTCYEIRQDFAAVALENLRRYFFGEAAFTLRIGDVYEPMDCGPFDRVVLDLPEPWRFIQANSDRMRAGAVLVAHLPNVTQVRQLAEALAKGGFYQEAVMEVLERKWVIEGPSARPDHRMVAHTAFLVRARKKG